MAVSGLRWMGLRSPDTAAYARPISPGNSHTPPVHGPTGSCVAAGAGPSPRPPGFPRLRYVDVSRHSTPPDGAEHSDVIPKAAPFGWSYGSPAHTS